MDQECCLGLNLKNNTFACCVHSKLGKRVYTKKYSIYTCCITCALSPCPYPRASLVGPAFWTRLKKKITQARDNTNEYKDISPRNCVKPFFSSKNVTGKVTFIANV